MTVCNLTIFSNLSMFYLFEHSLSGSCLGPAGKLCQLNFHFRLRQLNFRLCQLNFRFRLLHNWIFGIFRQHKTGQNRCHIGSHLEKSSLLSRWIHLQIQPKIESFNKISSSFYTLNQRYTYRVLQTIQMKLILLCVWAEPAVLGDAKTALKFKWEI